MKKSIRLLLAAASMTVCGGVFAGSSLTFYTASGTSFTNYFSVTPSADNKLTLFVSGLSAQFSLGIPAIVTADSGRS